MRAYPEQTEELIAAARKASREFGLMLCSSGNISWRVDDDAVLISASRSWLSELTAEQVVQMRLSDGEVVNGPRPSVESLFHLGILRQRPDVNVVLHFQSPYATLLCCRDLDGVQLEVLPEVPYYIGPVARIGYVLPGSPPLADAVVEQMKDHNLAILRNHGLVTVGATLDLAIQNAVFFELNCRMIVEGEGKTQGLSAEAIAELRSASQV